LKDPLRREVYLLSELESVDAWRGKIVDYTISEFIIPRINQKKTFTSAEVIAFAKKLCRARFEFAKAQRYKEENLKKTNHIYDYAALYEFEYLIPKNELHDHLKKAWEDIELALNNFLSNEQILDYLKTASYLVKQRNLKFKHHDFTIQGVPDLIAFFEDEPLHIIDWKVHFFGTKSYLDQLTIYALALLNCNPHRDFPVDLSPYTPYDIKLSEYQLLKNKVRNYSVTEQHLENLYDNLADGIIAMQRKRCDDDYKNLRIDDFEKTYDLKNCGNCPFKRICLED
jgi:hypothetical protein